MALNVEYDKAGRVGVHMSAQRRIKCGAGRGRFKSLLFDVFWG